MTLGTLLLTIVVTYLVLIAYGIVGLRRRRLAGRAKAVAIALLVAAPPALIAGLLLLGGERAVLAEWGASSAAMPVAGALVAVAADRIAARVGP